MPLCGLQFIDEAQAFAFRVLQEQNWRLVLRSVENVAQKAIDLAISVCICLVSGCTQAYVRRDTFKDLTALSPGVLRSDSVFRERENVSIIWVTRESQKALGVCSLPARQLAKKVPK